MRFFFTLFLLLFPLSASGCPYLSFQDVDNGWRVYPDFHFTHIDPGARKGSRLLWKVPLPVKARTHYLILYMQKKQTVAGGTKSGGVQYVALRDKKPFFTYIKGRLRYKHTLAGTYSPSTRTLTMGKTHYLFSTPGAAFTVSRNKKVILKGKTNYGFEKSAWSHEFLQQVVLYLGWRHLFAKKEVRLAPTR